MGVLDAVLGLIESGWMWGLLALGLWIATWLIYLRMDIRRRWNETQPHRWGVDLQSGKVTAGKKPLV